MSKSIQTTIEIYGQTFTIRAEPEEEKALQQVSSEVNEFLKQLSRKGTVPIHRLALMAAFQYAYELFMIKNSAPVSKSNSHEVNKRLDKILTKLQAALEEE
jgi:cell division protein ZapA (FtsZ GTPase activity inhibitor)